MFQRPLAITMIFINFILYFSFTLSHGSTSTPKDGLLWEQGQSAFLKGDWKNALYHFKKFTQEHPSSPHTLEAYYYSGITSQNLGDFKNSIPDFKIYIQRNAKNETGFNAQLLLIRSYFELNMFAEASLLSQEMIATHAQKKYAKILFLETLLSKAFAEVGLNNFDRAAVTLQDYYREKGVEINKAFDPMLVLLK